MVAIPVSMGFSWIDAFLARRKPTPGVIGLRRRRRRDDSRDRCPPGAPVLPSAGGCPPRRVLRPPPLPRRRRVHGPPLRALRCVRDVLGGADVRRAR